jgi:hypothetical protein
MFKDKLKAMLTKSKTDKKDIIGKNARLKSFDLKLPAGYGYRRQDRLSLYRFLVENISILNGSIWLWTRLCSAPVEFNFTGLSESRQAELIGYLDRTLSPLSYQKSGGIETIVNLFFRSLFIDGCFAGEVILNRQGNSIGEFYPCDSRFLSFEQGKDGWQLFYENETSRIKLEPGSFYYTGLDSSTFDPRGVSMLNSIGFVAHLEQKLIRDMSQSLERSGYQRVQVQLAKPEKLPGEADKDYVERANRYFDDTVDLMKTLKPADSAVTWDDVKINTIGPTGGGMASSWYLYHRSLVEDICAGMHLDPFMLGYSFGTTQTWARFKFELMMRQIIAVQEKARSFLKWLLNLEIALRGWSGEVNVLFDNRRVFGSLERFKAESIMTDSIIEQYKAGLLDKDEAREKLEKIEPGIV